MAGCSAVPGTEALVDEGTPGGSKAVAASPTPGGDSGPVELAPGLYTPLDFDQTGRYEFSLTNQYEADGTVAFTVRSTARTNMELLVDLWFGGSHQELLTGDRREVQDQLITLTDGTAADSDPLFFQPIYAPSA